jgi:hypothetical protein
VTRLARYQLLGYPMYSTVYKPPLYSSVSVYVPHDLNPRLERICTNCGFRAALDGWEDAGTIERCTPEEGARQNAAVMHMLGIGPPPPKLPIIQRIRETFFGRPKQTDPSEKHPRLRLPNRDLAALFEVAH